MIRASILLLYCAGFLGICQEKLSDLKNYEARGKSIILTTISEQKIRLTPYGDYIIRVQPVRRGEDFFPDDYYEMVEPKKWNGNFKVSDDGELLTIQTAPSDGVLLKIRKNPVSIEFYQKAGSLILLSEREGTVWENNRVYISLVFNDNENFTGLGHSYLGRSEKINLKGELIQRNYGKNHGEQAPLIVPFYISGKGYGIFLNSTFENFFNFGKDSIYEFGFDDHGFKSRMDYFFILGPEFPEILDRYTQLTGRPRLPVRAVFGLGLSDKGNPSALKSSSENWWKEKIAAHRKK
jgi:alpha-D-xyloside xylohydrolase